MYVFSASLTFSSPAAGRFSFSRLRGPQGGRLYTAGAGAPAGLLATRLRRS